MTVKAIETVYNGYKFRSRLEARWAVFFDTLGMKYEYEKEGFDLDGVWYLPDFWLPKHDCFIEIKGQEPTRVEINKACLLSLHTNKRVYVFAGGIAVPDVEDHYYMDTSNDYACDRNAWLFNPNDMTIVGHDVTSGCYEDHRKCTHGDNCPNIEEIRNNRLASPIYHQELSSLYGDSCKLQVTNEKELRFLVPVYEDSGQHHYIGRTYIPLPSIIKQYEHEYIQLFSCKPSTWEWGMGDMFALIGAQGNVWCECSDCQLLTIIPFGYVRSHSICKCGGEYIHDSPRLIAAYTAARQARFEHQR